MLVLGPRVSWKLWQTHRDELLKLCYTPSAIRQTSRKVEKLMKCWNESPLPSTEELKQAEIWSAGSLDIILHAPTRKRFNEVDYVYFWKQLGVKGSLLHLGNEIFCMTPSYLYVWFCARNSEISSIRFGMSLCSSFIQTSEGLLYQKPSICRVRQLQEVCALSAGRYGVNRATRCLKYVTDDAASPREIALYVLFVAPVRLGGCGFRGARCNYKVSIHNGDSCDSQLARYADICWPHERVLVEYDSDEFHAFSEKISQDSQRRTELMNQRYRTVSITNNEIKDLVLFRKSVCVIAKLLGRKMPRSEKFYQRQRVLHQYLL